MKELVYMTWERRLQELELARLDEDMGKPYG